MNPEYASDSGVRELFQIWMKQVSNMPKNIES
jgi:hypothetical protein